MYLVSAMTVYYSKSIKLFLCLCHYLFSYQYQWQDGCYPSQQYIDESLWNTDLFTGTSINRYKYLRVGKRKKKSWGASNYIRKCVKSHFSFLFWKLWWWQKKSVFLASGFVCFLHLDVCTSPKEHSGCCPTRLSCTRTTGRTMQWERAWDCVLNTVKCLVSKRASSGGPAVSVSSTVLFLNPFGWIDRL